MQMLLGGKWADAANGATMEVVNPANGQVFDTVPRATVEDAKFAIASAVEGQKEWVALPLYQRNEILRHFIALVQDHQEELAQAITRECGKPLAQARGEVDSICQTLDGYLAAGTTLYGKSMPVFSEKGREHDMIFTIYEPLGVIVAICPFNFPLSMFAHKVAPCLVAGNAVIVKPASDTPLSAILLANLAHQAGVPGKTLQVITGSGSELGQWLINDKAVNGVTLTGSTEVGKDIMRMAADHLQHVFLELGGNDILMIMDDFELDKAIEEACAGRLRNTGQACNGSKRLLVHNRIRKEFTDKLVARLKEAKIGDPMQEDVEVGPLVSEKAAITVEHQVLRTIQQGATLCYGGTRNGAFFTPTVLGDIRPDMDIAKDLEIFGPVFAILGFDTVEEAIAIANQSSYGLSGGILTHDMKVAFQVAKSVDTGAMVIGGHGSYRSIYQPFGGHKQSGLGVEGISETLKEFTKIKTIFLRDVL